MKCNLFLAAGMVAVAFLGSCSSSSENSLPQEIVLTNSLDSVSFALGVNIGGSLEMNNLANVDPAMITAGLQKSFMNDSSLMSLEATLPVIQSYQQRQETAVAGEELSNEVPQTVVLKDARDSVSFALGVNLANSLVKNEFGDVNTLLFGAGLQHAIRKDTSIMSIEATQNVIQGQQMAKQQAAAAKNREASAAFLADNATKEGIVTTPSGLQYKVITAGTGAVAKQGQLVVANYRGTLTDGTPFDNSYDRGTPFEFPVGEGRVIRGWDEAFMMMPVGSKWMIYLTPDLAYGDNPRPGGVIKPGMALVFEVELLGVKDQPVK